MKLHTLRPASGSRHRPKRVGCGPGSGHGKTSTRGHKGQRARSGSRVRPGFEGGQTPLYRRLPKRGFTHPKKEECTIINLNRLKDFEGTVTPEIFVKQGFLKNEKGKIKILGDGELKNPITVQAHSFSKTAKLKIEKAGGKAVIL